MCIRDRAAPARALPPAEQADAQTAAEAAENGPETEAEAGTAAEETSGDTETSADGTAAEDGKTSADGKTAEDGKTSEDTEEKPELPAIFSPEGSRLFLRANAALKRLDEDGDGPVRTKAKPDLKADPETDPKTAPKAAPKTQADSKEQPAHAGSAAADTAGTEAEAAQEDEARGKPEAVDGHERAAATTTARAAQPQQQPAGHFIAPTAVAVVPTAPVRRPRVEGGFDFFGTKGEASRDALEAVQNEDLADVVGQEALALHKAESEADFKPADEESRGIGQVIDLTAHDETEQIDLQGLRSAVS
uniref:hypothetical protein n=1 Tax=Streptomyces sp. NRRL WC-3774 TaxID=1463937 RepID=UPI0004C47FA6